MQSRRVGPVQGRKVLLFALFKPADRTIIQKFHIRCCQDRGAAKAEADQIRSRTVEWSTRGTTRDQVDMDNSRYLEECKDV